MGRRAQVESPGDENEVEARKLNGNGRRRVAELQTSVKAQIESNPLLFAGLALGAGFVVGGGLKAAVTGPLMRVGGGLAWKFIVLPAVASTLTRVLGSTEEE